MKIAIQISLLIVAGILTYLIYDGVQEKIEFKKQSQKRQEVVQERLLDIVTAQKEFKNEKGRYAGNFDELLNFLKNDSLTILKAIGSVPDSLTEKQAVEKGIVTRDTTQIPAFTIFEDNYPFDSLRVIPFSGGREFKLKAGEIEKNKMTVNVFEASATLEEVLRGMSLKNENVDPKDKIKVGSMTEPITTGNW